MLWAIDSNLAALTFPLLTIPLWLYIILSRKQNIHWIVFRHKLFLFNYIHFSAHVFHFLRSRIVVLRFVVIFLLLPVIFRSTLIPLSFFIICCIFCLIWEDGLLLNRLETFRLAWLVFILFLIDSLWLFTFLRRCLILFAILASVCLDLILKTHIRIMIVGTLLVQRCFSNFLVWLDVTATIQL